MKKLLYMLALILWSCHPDDPSPVKGETSVLDLPVKVQFDGMYDSVYISVSNPDTVRKLRLVIDPAAHIASGILTDITVGDWEVSVSLFKTKLTGKQSDLERGLATVSLYATTVGLSSTATILSVADLLDAPAEEPVAFQPYYVFYMTGNNHLRTIITLPADPENPFLGVEVPDPSWEYFYADRTFYFTKPDEPGSHYLQGAGALERYNDSNRALDYVNKIAFETVTGSVKDKTWNVADCVVIVTVKGIDRPLFIYEWDFRDTSGRMITKGK